MFLLLSDVSYLFPKLAGTKAGLEEKVKKKAELSKDALEQT